MASQQALRLDNPASEARYIDQTADIQRWLNEAMRAYQDTSSPRLSSRQVQERLQHATNAAEECLKIDPLSLEAMNIMARVTLDQKQLKVAEKWVKRAQALDKSFATSWYSLGQIKLAQQKFGAAEKAFEQCIALDDGIFRAHTSYAYTLLLQGKLVAAFEYYRRLAKANPNDDHVRSKLFECLRQLQADYDNPSLSLDLSEYLQWQDVNHNDLAAMSTSLLKHRYQINNPEAVVDLAKMASDPLFLRAMEKLIFHDAQWEIFLCDIRKHLLLSELQQFCAGNLRLLASFSQQSMNNEYALIESYAETQVVDILQEELSQFNVEAIIQAPLKTLLFSMYRPLKDAIGENTLMALSQLPSTSWGAGFDNIMNDLINLQCPTSEIEIEHFGRICDPVSQAVKGQYEHNPYPRWLALEHHTPTLYSDAIEVALSGFKAPPLLKKSPLRVLIAGCGTGRHALNVARYFRDVEVLAVDISHNSLSYAKGMAERYLLDNVEFLQADILQLEALDREFDIIECSGVLHHMDNPLQGAQCLKNILAPKGLLKVGLYSERARSSVVACREAIATQNINADPAGIRQLRQQLLQRDKQDTRWSEIRISPDFYSASGCRDLLFHVKEHRFTPLQLKEFCDTLEIKFLGFSGLNTSTRDEYLAQFPTDKHMLNLENWDVFERQQQNLFSSMFQFYTQNT